MESSPTVSDLGQAIPEANTVTALTLGLDGRIYGGTNNGHLFSYFPEQGFNDLGGGGSFYFYYALTSGGDDKIYASSSSPYPYKVTIYDPVANTTQTIGSPGIIHYLTTNTNGQIYGMETYELSYYDQAMGSFVRLGKPFATWDILMGLTSGNAGKVYGGSWLGRLFVYDPALPWSTATNPLDLGQIRPEYKANHILSMTKGTDGSIYAGTSLGHLIKYNSISGLTDLGEVYPPGDAWDLNLRELTPFPGMAEMILIPLFLRALTTTLL